MIALGTDATEEDTLTLSICLRMGSRRLLNWMVIIAENYSIISFPRRARPLWSISMFSAPKTVKALAIRCAITAVMLTVVQISGESRRLMGNGF